MALLHKLTEKKGVYVSLENDPLLFVQGPPVYRYRKKVSRWLEESTSIFPDPTEKDVEKDIVNQASEQMNEVGKLEPIEKDETDTVMWKRLRFLSTDFAKHVYKPLRFHLHTGEQIFGAVIKLYPASVEIKSPNGDIVALEIQEIQEIWWGGRILPIRY